MSNTQQNKQNFIEKYSDFVDVCAYYRQFSVPLKIKEPDYGEFNSWFYLGCWKKKAFRDFIYDLYRKYRKNAKTEKAAESSLIRFCKTVLTDETLRNLDGDKVLRAMDAGSWLKVLKEMQTKSLDHVFKLINYCVRKPENLTSQYVGKNARSIYKLEYSEEHGRYVICKYDNSSNRMLVLVEESDVERWIKHFDRLYEVDYESKQLRNFVEILRYGIFQNNNNENKENYNNNNNNNNSTEFAY